MNILFILFLGLKLMVIQQPTPEYVSRLEGTVTQFQMANNYAFLAHNYASGRYFFDLKIGDEIEVGLSEGNKTFTVTEIKQYQALEPDDVNSNFIDLETGEELTAAQLFGKIYTDPNRLVLQTCIERGNEKSWGRLFVIANEPQ